MPKTRYTTVNGMLIGERTDGGNRIDYVPDALGSIVAAVDENLNTTYTAAYKPYGDVLASTGTGPRFTWVGTLGYLASAGVAYAEYSVRARILSSERGDWTSLDSFWPVERGYLYAASRPISYTDPSGNHTASCCCQVESPSFNISKDSSTSTGGRSLVKLSGEMEICSAPQSDAYATCTLQWWEKSNYESLKGQPLNQWFLVTPQLTKPKAAPNDYWIRQVPQSCPTTHPLKFRIADGPGIADQPQGTQRILCIKVVLTWGCPDYNAGHYNSMPVWQIITFQSGGPQIQISSSDKNADADAYCANSGGTWPTTVPVS